MVSEIRGTLLKILKETSKGILLFGGYDMGVPYFRITQMVPASVWSLAFVKGSKVRALGVLQGR